MAISARRETVCVQVGGVRIGDGAPISVQSMTNTLTADAEATASQICDLAKAGADIVRITVNDIAAATAVSEICERVADAGYSTPIVGDFHYNGHSLLQQIPACASALAKYRINPGNVGPSDKRDLRFNEICRIAKEHGKPVRIGINAGSLNQELLAVRLGDNARAGAPRTHGQIVTDCMVESALQSIELAFCAGLCESDIVVSCKSSSPQDLIDVHRRLSSETRQPLHLGLTEAGMGMRGIVWSAASMGILLNEGIGDTIRMSLTPVPGGDRCEEVYAGWELLQSLGLGSRIPSVTACPGCGRTSSTAFQELAKYVQDFVRERVPEWTAQRAGVGGMKLAVMGCIVNGPGESKAANIGISLPGTGESPQCPVYVDGERRTTLTGNAAELGTSFCGIIDDYVAGHYPAR